jgi:hypothetical protein
VKVAVIGIGEVFEGDVEVDVIVTAGPPTSDEAISPKEKINKEKIKSIIQIFFLFPIIFSPGG